MINFRRLSYAAICAVTACFAMAGCGGEQVKGVDPNLVSVTGRVTFEGTPLKSGDISFVPADNPTKAYAGTIDSSGNYSLAYSPSNKGALPGNYNVRVSALDGVPAMGKDGQPVEPKSLIPESYNNPETSGLKATVEKGKSNVFNFDLKKQ